MNILMKTGKLTPNIIKVKKYMPDPDFNYALIDEAKKQEQYDDDNPL